MGTPQGNWQKVSRKISPTTQAAFTERTAADLRPNISNDRKVKGQGAPKGRTATYLFTTQFPWTNIATFWMPRRTATESTEGPRRLIKLAKGMTFTEAEQGTLDRNVGLALPPQNMGNHTGGGSWQLGATRWVQGTAHRGLRDPAKRSHPER